MFFDSKNILTPSYQNGHWSAIPYLKLAWDAFYVWSADDAALEDNFSLQIANYFINEKVTLIKLSITALACLDFIMVTSPSNGFKIDAV